MADRVLAIDPGLANTGVVLWDGQAIVDSMTITTKGAGGRPDFDTTVRRAQDVGSSIEALVVGHQPQVVVMEAYMDFGGGHKRAVSYRWTTPLLMGYLIASLEAFPGLRMVYQEPTILGLYRAPMARWAKGQGGYLPGDDRLRNEHLRSAAAHLAHHLATERMGGRRR